MSLQTFSSFSGGAINAHIADELLIIAKKAVVFQQLGEKAKMPAGEGKTFQFNRYNRLDLPRSSLTEGTPPSSTDMSLSTVSAVSDQWGAYVALSDVAVLTIKHPLLQVAIELLGYQAAELVDREIIKVLQASANVTFGGAATSRAGLTATGSMCLTDASCQSMIAALRNRGAHPYENQNYVGVIDPSMEQDISQNSNNSFTLAAAYSNAKLLMNGEIGTWRGVRWMVSNLIPHLETLAAHSVTTPASPAGTWAAANYRIIVEWISKRTGFVEYVTDPAAVAFASLDSLALTTPTSTDYVYKVYSGLAGGGVGGPFYQVSDSTLAFAEIPASTAVVGLAPPTSGSTGVVPGASGTSLSIHQGWIFGRQAFCTVDLMNLQTFVSAPNATISDPLVQQRTVGYKLMFKAVIQNDDFIQRFEGLSIF
jgi:N4-gp56 family major capsid protein